ncbi:MAG: hypothetical protein RLZZ453_938 [Chlamydiota bacterium]|jgi:hypothetical protein
MSGNGNLWGTLTFQTLITRYTQMQSQVISQVRQVASRTSNLTPGKFLLLQFSMSQVTQIGESISNLIAQVQSTVMNMVRNQQKGG